MPSDTAEDGPVRVADIARDLGVGRDTVYRAIRAGQLPALRIGHGRGTLRITPQDRDAYLTACRANATSHQPRAASGDPNPGAARPT